MPSWILILLICITFYTPQLYAAPAAPDLLEATQPDGTKFKLRKRGDEFQNWTETEAGFTVLKNKKTKEWEYAIKQPDGKLTRSGKKVMPHLQPPAYLPRHLKPPRNTEAEKAQSETLQEIYQQRLQPKRVINDDNDAATITNTATISSFAPGDWVPAPISGSRTILVILVNFTDRTLTTSAAGWATSVFSTATGVKSVANYYKDNSFNTLAVTPASHSQAGNPAGVVTVSINYIHPNYDEDSKTNLGTAEPIWVAAAINAAAAHVSFATLDSNNNGYIERTEAVIYLIPAGYENSGSKKTPSVWAHATRYSSGGLAAAGKLFPVYAMNGELNDAGLQHPMGVMTHELGHQLCGLPDLYDTSYTNGAMGYFSLMAAGSWGRDNLEASGTTPVTLDAWSREYLGWTTPVIPSSSGTLSLQHPLSSPSSAYKFVNASISTSEYFLVEHRRQAGWDMGLRGFFGPTWQGGLLLTHIDITAGTVGSNDINSYTANNVAGGGHQGVVPVQASTASCNLLTTDSNGCPTTLFSYGNNAFWSVLTTPNSNYYNGTPSNFSLNNISLPAETLTAIISFAPPTQLTIIKDGSGSGTVTSAPAGISCNATCSAQFIAPSFITLTAVADAGSVFTGWSGGGCNETGACLVDFTEATNVTATFVLLTPIHSETFDTTTMPIGWTITDNAGTGAVWQFNNPGGRTNSTGGSGNFSIADSDAAGSIDMDTELRTPAMDLTGYSMVLLNFKTYFQKYSTEIADIDVSINGPNGPWTNIWRVTGGSYGPVADEIDISSLAAGKQNVLIRFRYYSANWDWYWQIDDIAITGVLLPQKSLTITPAFTTAGSVTGGGTVTGSNGISCQTVNGATSGTCVAIVNAGTTITLAAAPDANSLFSSWSGGGCSGNAGCSITLLNDSAVTATFSGAWKARLGITDYDTVTAAQSAAPPGGTILARATEFTENLNIGTALSLKGGYNADYSSNTDAFSTLTGSLTIGSGCLTVENLIIR